MHNSAACFGRNHMGCHTLYFLHQRFSVSGLRGPKTGETFCDPRKELFRKVQTFSAVEIDKFGSASLISRNTTDVNVIQNFLIMPWKWATTTR